MFELLNYYIDRSMIWVKRNLAYNKAASELHNLSDRELADLGIYRSDVHNVVLNTLKQRIPSRSF
jgi:uncharacterized protein YjiS (DUF1127 family)